MAAVKPIFFIIEKDEELLSMLDRILKKEYVIYSFAKADNYFYTLLERLKPNLMILEWLSYYSNSEKIIERVNSKFKDSCKILIITTTLEVRNLIPENTIDGFLMKPFNTSAFKELIRDLINLQRAEQR